MTKSTNSTDSNQGELFEKIASDGAQKDVSPRRGQRREFVVANRDELFFGALPLSVYLKKVGQLDVLRLTKALDELDWTAFESKYSVRGRPRLDLWPVLSCTVCSKV